MEKNAHINEKEDEAIIKRPKNYPFCHNGDSTVNTDSQNQSTEYITSNIYKYC